jgi:putative transcriptional regulator
MHEDILTDLKPARGNPPTEGGYLMGQLLVAMPTMADPRFQRTVSLVCAHSHKGAMAIVLNRTFGSVKFRDLLVQLGIDSPDAHDRMVHFGGPVESGRGFVLHSPDFLHEDTVMVDRGIALTGTLGMLKAIAAGHGPRRSLFALGYAGWGPGQLDKEIESNGWLSLPLDPEMLFDDDLDTKWDRALAQFGIDPLMLSQTAGHA